MKTKSIKAWEIVEDGEIVRSLFSDQFSLYLLRGDAKLKADKSGRQEILPCTITLLTKKQK